VPASAALEHVWVERAATACALGSTILGLAAEIEDRPALPDAEEGRGEERRWRRNAEVLGAIDLSIGDIFAVSALLPARVAVAASSTLSSLGLNMITGLAPSADAGAFWPAALHAYADAVGTVAADELRAAHRLARSARSC
jgi:hypothetical protein